MSKYTQREIVLLSKEQQAIITKLAGKAPEFTSQNRASKAAVMRTALEFFLQHESRKIDQLLGQNQNAA